MLSVRFSITMLTVVMLNAVMLNVVMLSAIYAEGRIFYSNPECCDAECCLC
jgi:hypothetical protein